MKAIILAAGEGKRLRPLTLETPKCLVPLGGRPLLEIWLRTLERDGFNHVLINLHHLHQKVLDFLGTYKGHMKIETVYEPKLRGSLGTILDNTDFYSDESKVLVLYADNFTTIRPAALMKFHQSTTLPATMVVFETDTPTECGIVETDNEGVVVKFEEKPQNPTSNLANAGIYVFDTDILTHFDHNNSNEPKDIGYHLLPKLIHKIAIFRLSGFFVDIGTVEKYNRANSYAQEHLREFE